MDDDDDDYYHGNDEKHRCYGKPARSRVFPGSVEPPRVLRVLCGAAVKSEALPVLQALREGLRSPLPVRRELRWRK